MECVTIKRCTVSKFDRVTSFAPLGFFFFFYPFQLLIQFICISRSTETHQEGLLFKGAASFYPCLHAKNKVTSFDSMHMHAHVYPDQLGGGGCISAKMDAALTPTGSQRRKHSLSRVFLSDHFSNEMNGPAMRGVEENG